MAKCSLEQRDFPKYVVSGYSTYYFVNINNIFVIEKIINNTQLFLWWLVALIEKHCTFICKYNRIYEYASDRNEFVNRCILISQVLINSVFIVYLSCNLKHFNEFDLTDIIGI